VLLGATNKYQFSIDGLSSNANVELLDYQGNVIQRSAKPGNAAEILSGTLPSGGYRLKVALTGSRDTTFNLRTQVIPQLPGITTTASEDPFYLNDDYSNQYMGVNDFRSGNNFPGYRPEFAGIDGAGKGIVIIDTGINEKHPFFKGRIVAKQDYIADKKDQAVDNNGHGTLVASIAAGKDPDGKYSGVAPGASIIALKAATNEGNYPEDANGRLRTVEQALQWVIENAGVFNIVSVNMSFGDSKNYIDNSDLLKERIKAAGINDELALLAKQGIVVVGTAGNDYAKYQEQGLSYPGADPNVLPVGAVWNRQLKNTDNLNISKKLRRNGSNTYTPLPKEAWLNQNDEVDFTNVPGQIWGASQRLSAPRKMVFASGAQIIGAGLGSSPSDLSNVMTDLETTQDLSWQRKTRNDKNPGFYLVSDRGTSMAAPQVAGMVALAQDVALKTFGTKLTPEKIRQLIYDTGNPLPDPTDTFNTKDGVLKDNTLGGYDVEPLKNTNQTYRGANLVNLVGGILNLASPGSLNVDLVPNGIEVAETVDVGGNITIKYRVKNQGTDTSPAFKVNIFLADNPLEPNTYLLGQSNPIDNLTGGNSTDLFTQTFTLPAKDSPYWKGFRGLPDEDNENKLDIGIVYMVVNQDRDFKETNVENNGILQLQTLSTTIFQFNEVPGEG
jgi:subtilisin family serine protease